VILGFSPRSCFGHEDPSPKTVSAKASAGSANIAQAKAQQEHHPRSNATGEPLRVQRAQATTIGVESKRSTSRIHEIATPSRLASPFATHRRADAATNQGVSEAITPFQTSFDLSSTVPGKAARPASAGGASRDQGQGPGHGIACGKAQSPTAPSLPAQASSSQRPSGWASFGRNQASAPVAPLSPEPRPQANGSIPSPESVQASRAAASTSTTTTQTAAAAAAATPANGLPSDMLNSPGVDSRAQGSFGGLWHGKSGSPQPSIATFGSAERRSTNPFDDP